MRCSERDVAEKRLLFFRLAFDELNRRIGEQVGGKRLTGVVRHHQAGDHAVDWHIDVCSGCTAEEHRLSLIKTFFKRRRAIVPFTSGKCLIAGFLKHLWHQHPGVKL